MYVSLYMCVYKQYSKVRQMVNFMHGSQGRGGGGSAKFKFIKIKL